MVNYWAFLGNPTIYRVHEAIIHRTVDLWMTKRKPVRAGDRAIIWKAAVRDDVRGVAALGEILADRRLCRPRSPTRSSGSGPLPTPSSPGFRSGTSCRPTCHSGWSGRRSS